MVLENLMVLLENLVVLTENQKFDGVLGKFNIVVRKFGGVAGPWTWIWLLLAIGALQRAAAPATSRRCNVLIPSGTACRWRRAGSAAALRRCGVVIHRRTLQRGLSGQLRGVRVPEQRCGAAAWRAPLIYFSQMN